MNQIEPYKLWIGHAGDGRDSRELMERGIKAIVQVALEELPLQPPRELIYFRIPLLDGSGNNPATLSLAIRCVVSLMQQGTPTLVCCGAGMSRSPTIVASALSTLEHADMDECLMRVTQSHPADVSPVLWEEVRCVIEREGGGTI